MKLRNPLLLIILCVFAVACRMGTGENALLHNEENGISIIYMISCRTVCTFQ